jgi:hypothetical protein
MAVLSLCTVLVPSSVQAYAPYEPPAQTSPTDTTGPMLPANAGDRCTALRSEGSQLQGRCRGVWIPCELKGVSPIGHVVQCSVITSPTDNDPEGSSMSHTLILANGVPIFDTGRTPGIPRVLVADPYVFVAGTMIGPISWGEAPRVLFRTPERTLRMDYVVYGDGSGPPPRLHTCLHEWDWHVATQRYVRGAQHPGMTEDMCFADLEEVCQGMMLGCAEGDE